MGLRKYQSVEKHEVLSEDEHKAVEASLHKLGKTSAAELTDEEREQLQQDVEDAG